MRTLTIDEFRLAYGSRPTNEIDHRTGKRVWTNPYMDALRDTRRHMGIIPIIEEAEFEIVENDEET